MKGRDLVAWNLRRLRVERELSQDALALEADVDRTYVGRWSVGLRTRLSAFSTGSRRHCRFSTLNCLWNQQK
jgi:hypothetical protein